MSGCAGCAAPRPARRVELVEVGHFAPTFDGGMAAADRWSLAGVTAVVAYNDLVALGLLNAPARPGRRRARPAERRRLRRHPDVGRWCTPALTTLAIPKEKAGRAAVDLLLHLLADPGAARHAGPGAAHRAARPAHHRLCTHHHDAADRPTPPPAALKKGTTHAHQPAHHRPRLERSSWQASWPACGAPSSPNSQAGASTRGGAAEARRSRSTLNILDVAGNLQLTQGMIDDFVKQHPDVISKVTYSKAPAPELAGKIKAQQDAGRVDIDLVLTGTDGLAAGIEQGLWQPLLPDVRRRGCPT